MKIIESRSKRGTGRTALLALAATAAVYFYAYPGSPTAEASPPKVAEAERAVPEDKGSGSPSRRWAA